MKNNFIIKEIKEESYIKSYEKDKKNTNLKEDRIIVDKENNDLNGLKEEIVYLKEMKTEKMKLYKKSFLVIPTSGVFFLFLIL